MDKLFIVTDLGPGDGGKGTVVHALSRKYMTSNVIVLKEGGAQGCHGVWSSTGKNFNFSHWGCGTIEGVKTHLTKRFVAAPVHMLAEATRMMRGNITNDPFSLISADPQCLVATPYHQAWSQLAELKLRDNPRGTVGLGIGKAFRDAGKNPDNAMYLANLPRYTRDWLRKRLCNQKQYILEQLSPLSEADILPEDAELFRENYQLLTSEDYLDEIVDIFMQVGKLLTLRETGGLLEAYQTGITERSHGILTDSHCGLIPHTSALQIIPKQSEDMYRNLGYDGEVLHLGVHRAYEIRHGAGPMPSFDPDFTKNMLKKSGTHKEENRFQGKVRMGPLDLVLLKYALKACRVSGKAIDGLCITWFDRIIETQTWNFCDYYPDLEMDFANESLGSLRKKIFKAQEFHRISIPFRPRANKIAQAASEILKDFVDVPLRLISTGPTELDKIFI